MKKTLLLAGGAMFAAVAMNAQQLRGPESETDTRQPYVQWPQSYSLDQYIQNWTPGEEITRTYGANRVVKEGWEDEEFFTSRVKLRPLIRNTATQIYEAYSESNDKRLLFWVPCGMSSGYFQTGALPNAVFDSEAFSTWSYVTHYGNWTSPYGWVPGAFADAAHKHGVLVSGVASIPWAENANSGNWGGALNGMVNLASSDEGLDKVAKFLRYHGVDGLGYNSEFSASSTLMNGIRNLHGKLVKKMVNDYGAAGFENPWYGFTTDAGGTMDGSYLSSSYYQNFGYSDEPRTIMFLNYNWNTAGRLSTTAQGVSATGRAPQDVYLGMNMQGGMSKDGTDGSNEWVTHLNHPYSIGLWGEHSKNMLFPTRVSYGGSDMLKQKGYQRVIEQWFGNGRRNPAAKMNISSNRALSPDDNFHGMSRLMSARSAYGWSLDDEPFITYFSLGNGLKYYMDGQVANDNEWYNLGMQDYTPTWRFWWADKMLGKTPSDIPANSMDAEYTWEDAWNGGSSLKISGSTSEGQSQYLHLFKTAFTVKNNDIVTVRYKILKGNGNINFLYSKVGSESTEQTPTKTAVHKTSDSFFYDEWNVVELKVAARGANVLSAGDWATVGLKFSDAKDLEVLIGEISIKRGTSKTPAMPVIRRGSVLSDVVTGLDAKLIWNMPNNKAAGDPVYNVDVNTSHFELWAQVEDGEPQFMGTTTSWAGIMFRIANPEHKRRVKLGVQAVSLDHRSKSGITWSNDYYDAPTHEISEEVKIDKTCIKPGQEFRIWFVDDLHPNATLSLYNAQGVNVASNNGASRELVTSLDGIGAYDLVANEGTSLEKRYTCFAQVSDFSVGAVPEIKSLTLDGSEVGTTGVEFAMNEAFKVGYTGAEADGSGSRGITTAYKTIGGPIKEMQLGENKSFSVSYWVRISEMPATGVINLFGIEDRTGSWPENNWGFFWSHIESDGWVEAYTKRGNSSNTKEYQYKYPKTTVVAPGAWTHVTHVFDYDNSNALLMKLYINGVYQVPIKSGLDQGNGVGVEAGNVIDGIPVRAPNREVMRDGMWMHILGGRGSEQGFPEAIVDDVTVWDGAITDADIAKAMVGLDANNLPSNVKCFWDFENEPISGISETRVLNGVAQTTIHNGRFESKGQITNATLGTFDLLKGEGEGQAMQTHITPAYEAGCPYVKGTAFAVETKPTWSTRQATISNASGNDTKGEATVVYGAKGEKTLTLKLKNSWGEDTKTYPVVTVGDASSIEGVEADGAANVYSMNKTLFVEFAEGGDYEVSVYNMSGMLVGSDARSINGGEMMRISIGQAGVYVVNIVKDGNELRTVKVVNK